MRSSTVVLGLVAMLLVAWPAARVVHGDQGQDAAGLTCAVLCFERWYSCVTACLGHGGSGADVNDCNVVHGQDSCSAACYNGVMSCVVGCTNNGSQLPDPSCPDECTEDYDSCMEICMPDPEKLSAPIRP
ncbi:hypothetical protein PS2_021252 [Malus domestica]